MKIRPAHDAFSLVELSIALAIVGLLAGGVVVGSSLIERSKVNQVTTGLTKYGTAFVQFQRQYQALPGDYQDATEQWGTDTASGCPVAPTASAAGDRVAKTLTCNGNGNQVIAIPETFRVWQHLANAGLIEGMYTGVSDRSGASGTTPVENAPAGPYANSAYFMSTSGPLSAAANFYDQGQFTQITLGAKVSNNWPSAPILTPKEQYGMDLKIDDGRPSTGYMHSLKSGLNANCTTSDTDASAEYSLSQKGRNCTVYLMLKNS